jgi:uncharacterized protein (UPF0261 family)
MAGIIREADGVPIMMDVSILSDPPYTPDYSRHDIAEAANTTIDAQPLRGWRDHSGWFHGHRSGAGYGCGPASGPA